MDVARRAEAIGGGHRIARLEHDDEQCSEQRTGQQGREVGGSHGFKQVWIRHRGPAVTPWSPGALSSDFCAYGSAAGTRNAPIGPEPWGALAAEENTATNVIGSEAAAGAPAIDGELDDACWREAATADYFCAADGTACAIDPTTFYFAYDEGTLYVAARCEQEDMGALVVKGKERDDFVHTDDCVGFFFLPDPQENVFYQVYANADGVVYDIAYAFAEPAELDTEGAAAWNGDYEIATGRGDGYWTFEAAIPVASFGRDAIMAGDEWRINFRRKEQARGGSADWQYPIGFDPRRFGYLAFE